MKQLFAMTCILWTASSALASDPSNELYEKFQNELKDFAGIRHELHQNPETKYREFTTSTFIADKLKSYGYRVQRGIGGTGVVALLESGKPGKTVALRADMDALPITETTSLPYASKNLGVMHACGHDGHMATLLMVAKVLQQSPYFKRGKIKFIFQPAEEGGAGADRMIKDGVLENPDVDAIFGYHNWPLDKGVIGTRAGCLMAGADRFDIWINGKGGHAAMPHLTDNPIYRAAEFTLASQRLISQKNPTEPAVLNIASVHSGTTYNVVPDTVHLMGTLRTTSNQSRENLINKLTELCSNQDQITIQADNYPPTINTKKETDLVLKTAREILAEDQVISLDQPVMPAEDFSFYLQKVPGCFFFVGYGQDKPGLHEARYDFSDEIMPRAAYVLAKTALNYLS